MDVQTILNRIDFQINQIESDYAHSGIDTEMLRTFKFLKIRELNNLKEWIENSLLIENENQ